MCEGSCAIQLGVYILMFLICCSSFHMSGLCLAGLEGMQQAALTNRLQAAPDLIYQLIGAVRRVPKGLASASAFFFLWGLGDFRA